MVAEERLMWGGGGSAGSENGVIVVRVYGMH